MGGLGACLFFHTLPGFVPVPVPFERYPDGGVGSGIGKEEALLLTSLFRNVLVSSVLVSSSMSAAEVLGDE
jgi:hypothetical protein